MQEVFTRFVRISNGGAAIANPKALLYGIASNVLKEFVARKRTGPVAFNSDLAEDAAEHPLPLPVNDVLEQVGAREQLRELLARLPVRYRECVLLHKRDGMDFDEIAKRLEISRHTAKKYTTLGLTQIRLMQLRRP